jgi:hypothetical protein
VDGPVRFSTPRRGCSGDSRWQKATSSKAARRFSPGEPAAAGGPAASRSRNFSTPISALPLPQSTLDRCGVCCVLRSNGVPLHLIEHAQGGDGHLDAVHVHDLELDVVVGERIPEATDQVDEQVPSGGP